MQNETHRQHSHTFSFSSIIAAFVLLFTSAASHGQALFEGCCGDESVVAGACVGLSSCTEAFIRFKEAVTGGFSCEGRPVNFESAVMFQPQSNQPGWYIIDVAAECEGVPHRGQNGRWQNLNVCGDGSALPCADRYFVKTPRPSHEAHPSPAAFHPLKAPAPPERASTVAGRGSSGR